MCVATDWFLVFFIHRTRFGPRCNFEQLVEFIALFQVFVTWFWGSFGSREFFLLYFDRFCGYDLFVCGFGLMCVATDWFLVFFIHRTSLDLGATWTFCCVCFSFFLSLCVIFRCLFGFKSFVWIPVPLDLWFVESGRWDFKVGRLVSRWFIHWVNLSLPGSCKLLVFSFLFLLASFARWSYGLFVLCPWKRVNCPLPRCFVDIWA